jgi:hypothetical protein
MQIAGGPDKLNLSRELDLIRPKPRPSLLLFLSIRSAQRIGGGHFGDGAAAAIVVGPLNHFTRSKQTAGTAFRDNERDKSHDLRAVNSQPMNKSYMSVTCLINVAEAQYVPDRTENLLRTIIHLLRLPAR